MFVEGEMINLNLWSCEGRSYEYSRKRKQGGVPLGIFTYGEKPAARDLRLL